MIRVASYCRVSTDKEDQANSFEAQVRYFQEYIQHKSGWILADIYADDDAIIGPSQNPSKLGCDLVLFPVF